jgi:hypothetical protein
LDLARIINLAQPKTNPKQSIDIKKEKSEFANEIIQRKEDAGGFINHVYKTFTAGTINEYVTSIESLHIVKDKIH